MPGPAAKHNNYRLRCERESVCFRRRFLAMADPRSWRLCTCVRARCPYRTTVTRTSLFYRLVIAILLSPDHSAGQRKRESCSIAHRRTVFTAVLLLFSLTSMCVCVCVCVEPHPKKIHAAFSSTTLLVAQKKTKTTSKKKKTNK